MWKQIGVIDIIDNSELPFFIQWQTQSHPSEMGKAVSSVESINIKGDIDKVATLTSTKKEELKDKFKTSFSNIDIDFKGIESVIFKNAKNYIEIQ